ncbi:PAS domain-containing protein [Alsobacter sp. SYSU BS001988]|jgi:hypothetical protein
MKHGVTQSLFAYWNELRGQRSAPERSEVDPGRIRHILADTFIIEVDAERLCPVRLAGARISALAGRELKGASFMGLWRDEFREDAVALVDVAVNNASAVVASVTGSSRDGRVHDLELLLLPLRHRGKTHSRLLGALSPLAAPPRLGLDPVAGFEVRSRRIIDATEVGTPTLRPPRERLANVAPIRRGHLFVFAGGRIDGAEDAAKPPLT